MDDSLFALSTVHDGLFEKQTRNNLYWNFMRWFGIETLPVARNLKAHFLDTNVEHLDRIFQNADNFLRSHNILVMMKM